MLVTLRKNGNSVVVTIPREELEAAGVSVGDTVNLTLTPVEVRPRLRADMRAIIDREFENWRPALDYLGRGSGAESVSQESAAHASAPARPGGASEEEA